LKIYILCILAILLHGCPTSTESKIDNEYLTGGFTATFAASASLVETAQVTITWAAVAGATRYELQYGSTAGTYTTTISPVTGGSHLVTGLTNGTLYYFLVVAYKADGSSTNSNVVSARPNTAPNPPTAVLDGSVTTSTAAAPTISWAASTSSSDVDFGGYEIALGTTAGATDTLTWTPVGNVLSYTPSVGITLIDGSVYYATVRAYRSSSIKSTAANGDGFTVNSLTATFRCNFLTSTSTDCYASPYTTTARPVVRYFRAGSASTSPGTYVDSAGVVKIANTNLFPSSEDFTSSWALGGGTRGNPHGRPSYRPR